MDETRQVIDRSRRLIDEAQRLIKDGRAAVCTELPSSRYKDHNRVTMNTIANSEVIAVRLQKICTAPSVAIRRATRPDPQYRQYSKVWTRDGRYPSHMFTFGPAICANDMDLIDQGRPLPFPDGYDPTAEPMVCRLSAGESWIRTFGTGRERIRFCP